MSDTCSTLWGSLSSSPPDDWLTQVPTHFLHRGVTLTTLDRWKSWRYPAFIKPLKDKVFRAKVYANALDLLEETKLVDPRTPVVVSEPVEFEAEYHCLILQNRIKKASLYTKATEAPRPKSELSQAILFSHEVVHRMPSRCPDAFILDVGRLVDYHWAVVNANPCWEVSTMPIRLIPNGHSDKVVASRQLLR